MAATAQPRHPCHPSMISTNILIHIRPRHDAIAEDLWIETWSHLSIRDVVQLPRVCKEWRRMSSMPRAATALWLPLFRRVLQHKLWFTVFWQSMDTMDAQRRLDRIQAMPAALGTCKPTVAHDDEHVLLLPFRAHWQQALAQAADPLTTHSMWEQHALYARTLEQRHSARVLLRTWCCFLHDAALHLFVPLLLVAAMTLFGLRLLDLVAEPWKMWLPIQLAVALLLPSILYDLWHGTPGSFGQTRFTSGILTLCVDALEWQQAVRSPSPIWSTLVTAGATVFLYTYVMANLLDQAGIGTLRAVTMPALVFALWACYFTLAVHASHALRIVWITAMAFLCFSGIWATFGGPTLLILNIALPFAYVLIAATLWPHPRPLTTARLFVMLALCVLALVQILLLALHAWWSLVMVVGLLCAACLLMATICHAWDRLWRSRRLCMHYAAINARYNHLVELAQQRVDVCALVASRLRVAFLDA